MLQESDRYKKLIKQHIDIRTILSRVERGFYSDSLERFFRDLLLLFTNFILFFKKTSQECAAAYELRALVIKDMSDKLHKKPTVDKHPNSKSTRHSTIVPCSGLRSSVKAKSEIPAASTSKKGGDNSKKDKEIEEKPKVNQQKKVEDLSLDRDEHNNRTSSSIKKKRSDERSSVSGRRNPRSSSSNNSKSVETKHKCGGNELSSHDMTMFNRKEKDKVVKTTTATVNSNTNKKKQGVASFLKRMKQNSPGEVAADEEEDEDEGKDEVESQDDASKNDEDEEEEEQERKRQGNKNEVRRVTRSGRGGGRVVEKDGIGKSRRAVRTTGGSNKRSSTGGPPETRMGKRGRETNVGGKSEVGRSKKRTRR